MPINLGDCVHVWIYPQQGISQIIICNGCAVAVSKKGHPTAKGELQKPI